MKPSLTCRADQLLSRSALNDWEWRFTFAKRQKSPWATNREHQLRARAAGTAVGGALGPFVAAFDNVWYAGDTVSESDYRSLLELSGHVREAVWCSGPHVARGSRSQRQNYRAGKRYVLNGSVQGAIRPNSAKTILSRTHPYGTV